MPTLSLLPIVGVHTRVPVKKLDKNGNATYPLLLLLLLFELFHSAYFDCVIHRKKKNGRDLFLIFTHFALCLDKLTMREFGHLK